MILEMILNRHLARSGRSRENLLIGKKPPTGAMEHAQSVWTRSLIASMGDDLSFIGTLCEHVSTCRVCGLAWIEGDRPTDHLEAWLRVSKVRDIWQAVA